MHSLRSKLIAGIISCMLLGTLALVMVLNALYKENLETAAQQSLQNAQNGFNNMINSEASKLSASLTVLLENKEIKDIFLLNDRKSLFHATVPIFTTLENKFSITHWYFINPETADPAEARKCFLRVHDPDQYDDIINRITYQKAVENKTFAYGIELGKTAFALRVVHPYYNNGNLIGYMELGEEIDHFFEAMKQQTGDDYALLINKKYLDTSSWASVRINKGLENNWDNMKDVVIVENTTPDEHIIHFDGNLEDLPERGRIIEEIHKGPSVFIRGIFPIRDAGNKRVGGIFVIRDITAIYNNMLKMQWLTVAFILILMIVITVFVIYIINKLILVRLDKMTRVITRVVGGDFNSKIIPSSDDEIGKFESLFEQFRSIFVNTLKGFEKKP